MNFKFSDNEKILFQEMESVLTQEKQIFVHDALHTEKEIASALITIKQKIISLGYMHAFSKASPIGSVAALEMMRIFAKHQPSLFLGFEYGFRIFNEMRQWLTEPQIQSLHIDDSPTCAIAFCEDVVETDTKPSLLTVQSNGDHFLLSGEKRFVINAGIAKYFAVNGEIDNKSAIFFIPLQSEGLEIHPLMNKRIFPGLAIANIQFCNCMVSKSMVFFPQHINSLISHLQFFENIVCIACALGMMDQCIEITTGFAKTHQSENKPLIAHQAVAFSLAEAVTLRQTAELLAYRAAWMFDSGDSEKNILNQCAKVFCSEAAETIASQCMNILGGQVFIDNHIVEQILCNSKFIQLIGISTHLARIAIADVVLK